MMFPYLELPVCIGYGEGQDEKVVIGKFQPVKISAYHEGYFQDVGMFIYFDGQPVQIALSLKEYERRIAAYWQTVNNKNNVKQKLGIVQ